LFQKREYPNIAEINHSLFLSHLLCFANAGKKLE